MLNSIESVATLIKAVEAKNTSVKEHSINVMNYSLLVAKKMGLSKEKIKVIRNAALLHDIGKIGIDENILSKKGKLTEKEFGKIKSHSILGVSMIKHIQFLKKSLPSILHHHEWYNGNGYPAGLKGSEIPLGARIIAAADAFDAMSSWRPYRNVLPSKKVIKELVNGAGTQFSPEIICSFLQVIKEHKLLPELSGIEESIEKVRKKVQDTKVQIKLSV